MPVLLSEEQDFETWLSGDLSEAFALARSYDARSMAHCAVRVREEGLAGSVGTAAGTFFRFDRIEAAADRKT
jgi:hypothetical protein